MRFLLILLLVIICINFMDTRKKKSKPKPKPKPKGKPVRPTVLNQPNPAIFKKYTRRGRGGRCWWDMSRTDCAVCRKGGVCVDTLCTTTVLRTHQERAALVFLTTNTHYLPRDILATGTILIGKRDSQLVCQWGLVRWVGGFE